MRKSQQGLRVSNSKMPRFIQRMGIFNFIGLIASIGLMIFAVMFILRRSSDPVVVYEATAIPFDFGEVHTNNDVAVPAYSASGGQDELSRSAYYLTNQTDNSTYMAVDYTVQALDSIFAIAEAHNIEPETLLWANEDAIVNVDELSPGMELKIPPVDGVYYQWQIGDTLESVAHKYSVSIEDILDWPGNTFIDLTNPVIESGTYVMVPGGEGDFQAWVRPVVPSGTAGVNTNVYGPGGCSGSFSGAYGSGSFVWPTPIHTLTGNDYWDGHLAVDLATSPENPIYAADSGVVIFAGWSTGGYGNMVMLDHQNGFQTVYAHLSSYNVGCGQSVGQGQTIGWGGSTGNSTGNHLHFEIRLNGGYVNPWYYLP